MNSVLVMDANILIRGVFGLRVPQLLNLYLGSFAFYTPDICLQDAIDKVPSIAERRGIPVGTALPMLYSLAEAVQVVDRNAYSAFETQARERVGNRDMDDWPIVATALMFQAPLWTEDQDFFGIGLATWNTSNVPILFRERTA